MYKIGNINWELYRYNKLTITIKKNCCDTNNTRKCDVANHAKYVDKKMPRHVNFQHHTPYNMYKVTKRVAKKGVSGIKHFYWVNPVSSHYNS